MSTAQQGRSKLSAIHNYATISYEAVRWWMAESDTTVMLVHRCPSDRYEKDTVPALGWTQQLSRMFT